MFKFYFFPKNPENTPAFLLAGGAKTSVFLLISVNIKAFSDSLYSKRLHAIFKNSSAVFKLYIYVILNIFNKILLILNKFFEKFVKYWLYLFFERVFIAFFELSLQSIYFPLQIQFVYFESFYLKQHFYNFYIKKFYLINIYLFN